MSTNGSITRGTFAAVLALNSIVACASTVSPAGDGFGATDAASTRDTGLAAPHAITCPEDAGIEFAASLAACVRASDCVVVMHGLDCCGSREYVGINGAQRNAYDAPESACEMRLNFAHCRCEAQPSVAQDGRIVQVAADAIVDCVGGQCLTHAR